MIGVSLSFLVQQHNAGPSEFLFNGEFLPPSDADRIEMAIATAGLNGWEREGNRIKVPSGQKAQYLAAVAKEGALPPNFHSLLEKALDLGPFVDDKTRRERLKAAREQQLSMIIRAMDGIEDAKVIYDVLEPRGMSQKGHASATVSVRPRPGEALDGKLSKMIAKAVAGAIANLKPEDVVVVNLGEGSSYSGDVTAESFDTPYFQHRVAYESHMRQNVEKLLSFIPGVHVEVTAELSHALTKESRIIANADGEPTALRESNQEKTSETQHINNGGRPGLVAQGPGRGNEAPTEVTVKNTEGDTTSESNYFVPTKDELVTEAGLIPENVRVAVAVPMNYLIQIYREQQRRRGEDPTQPLPKDLSTTLEVYRTEVTQQITGVVETLLPKELTQNNYSDVKISFFESITPEAIEPIPTSSKALAWASENFNTLTMAGVALVGLVMLRSLVKAIPPADPLNSSAAPLLSLSMPGGSEEEAARGGGGSGGGGGGEPEIDAAGRPRLKLKKGNSLKDELTSIVKEDPDAAADILRNWIANAS